MNADYILQMRAISKSFPGVQALSNVDFNLRKGEIHALMGENGAGKSTLIKVLTGVYKRESGETTLNGKPIAPRSPEEAQQIGISTVYQEVNLCPNLTVAENIFIGRYPRKRGFIDWAAMNRRSEQLLARLELHVDVTEPLSHYSVAVQQMVAIARAVDISSGVLILDEPTSSLDTNEVRQLFAVMRKLRDEGMGIIFVTHFLDQVYEITDRITVLRNGELVGEYETSELPRTELVSRMIGKEWNPDDHIGDKKDDGNKGEVFLHTTDLGKKGSMESVNLSVHKGEVLGLAGLLGSGRTEIAKLIFGIDKADSGVLTIDNDMISSMYPQKAVQQGLGFTPEDRKIAGIVGELTIRENIVLALQARQGLFSFIPVRKQKEIAQKYIDLLQIKTPGTEQKIENLSGGNQQKVILARWLTTQPRLLILDEPTRGIDVGSKLEIRKLILELAASGISILFISAELEEMVQCCDRVIVLRDRNQIGELQGSEMTEQRIMQMIAEGAEQHGETSGIGA
ncbi:sugar ABC transporter ATP-binding protein [Paenibacillus sp. MSJ-34]|uniref:sugar ABC transporter ATP-binding protein n=1 Tax=Paenibacillus sp. MSJ-34 TaxID=2841529 RepID=UPI001C11BEB4|nr:sugar ABC transporter ATP-binding protein [Paenibacillus sp. MSJ-34]MBU5442167.1 sugar ABC transporter ATP-binding protein [Paenibacillus sp. MSJ-34]